MGGSYGDATPARLAGLTCFTGRTGRRLNPQRADCD
jgi:hypothetical protein